MTTLSQAVAGTPEESVTLTVKLNVPAAVGVPAKDSRRLQGRDRPGSAPAGLIQAYQSSPTRLRLTWPSTTHVVVPSGRDNRCRLFNGIELDEDESEDPPPQP